jgi:hypothetical protein
VRIFERPELAFATAEAHQRPATPSSCHCRAFIGLAVADGFTVHAKGETGIQSRFVLH